MGIASERSLLHVSFQIDLRPGVELPEGGLDPEVSSGDGHGQRGPAGKV